MKHAAFALLVVACGRTEVYQAMLRAPEPGGRGRAEIFVEKQPPARAFYEVALVQAVGVGGEADMEHLARALGERGGRLGCDAVVNVSFDQGASIAHAYGVCVRWSTAAAAPTRATSPPAAREGDDEGDDEGTPL